MARNIDREFLTDLMDEFDVTETQRLSTLINALDESSEDDDQQDEED